jgi:hypothetical protein
MHPATSEKQTTNKPPTNHQQPRNTPGNNAYFTSLTKQHIIT